MKRIVIIATLLLSVGAVAQEEIKVGSKYGVDINYTLLKTKEAKKKDVYLIVATATNTNDYDLYYTARKVGTAYDNSFTKIKVRNATGIFSKGRSIHGNNLNVKTTEGLLSVIKAGEIYNFENTFRVKKGVKPMITNTFIRQLKNYEDFTILLNASAVNGEWKTSCGSGSMSLDYGSQNLKNGIEEKTVDAISQVVNGKQFVWLKIADNSFVRQDNNEYTLSYNNDTGMFKYSTSDGITCDWSKI
ncbi:MAG: hypothetical protein COA67_09925 [Lutibacter sp.]|nr:MAG: hypothetical protein COA67_09925 [Lutibacter sp.]